MKLRKKMVNHLSGCLLAAKFLFYYKIIPESILRHWGQNSKFAIFLSNAADTEVCVLYEPVYGWMHSEDDQRVM